MLETIFDGSSAQEKDSPKLNRERNNGNEEVMILFVFFFHAWLCHVSLR